MTNFFAIHYFGKHKAMNTSVTIHDVLPAFATHILTLAEWVDDGSYCQDDLAKALLSGFSNMDERDLKLLLLECQTNNLEQRRFKHMIESYLNYSES
jgi:hypothetical protein